MYVKYLLTNLGQGFRKNISNSLFSDHIEAESLFNAMNEALDAIDNLKIYKPKVPKSSKDYLRIISNKAGETGQGQFGVRMM